MKLKTVQWNIGGAKIRGKDTEGKYSEEGLAYIVNELKIIKPDVITFQEIHEGPSSQTEQIATVLNMQYWAIDSYDQSHIDPKYQLSQSIISKYPLSNHRFELFMNPGYEIFIGEHIYPCHDKGLTSVDIEVGGTKIAIKTLHLIPFGLTKVDPLGKVAEKYRKDISIRLIDDNRITIIQGDFNFDGSSLSEFLHVVNSGDYKELIQNQPTTPSGKIYDHIIFKGARISTHEVRGEATTDHFPIISEFLIDE